MWLPKVLFLLAYPQAASGDQWSSKIFFSTNWINSIAESSFNLAPQALRCKFSHYFRLTFSNYFGSFSEIMCNFFADYFRFCDFPQVLCTFFRSFFEDFSAPLRKKWSPPYKELRSLSKDDVPLPPFERFLHRSVLFSFGIHTRGKSWLGY
jgi:hypothetical protein